MKNIRKSAQVFWVFFQFGILLKSIMIHLRYFVSRQARYPLWTADDGGYFPLTDFFFLKSVSEDPACLCNLCHDAHYKGSCL